MKFSEVELLEYSTNLIKSFVQFRSKKELNANLFEIKKRISNHPTLSKYYKKQLTKLVQYIKNITDREYFGVFFEIQKNTCKALKMCDDTLRKYIGMLVDMGCLDVFHTKKTDPITGKIKQGVNIIVMKKLISSKKEAKTQEENTQKPLGTFRVVNKRFVSISLKTTEKKEQTAAVQTTTTQQPENKEQLVVESNRQSESKKTDSSTAKPITRIKSNKYNVPQWFQGMLPFAEEKVTIESFMNARNKFRYAVNKCRFQGDEGIFQELASRAAKITVYVYRELKKKNEDFKVNAIACFTSCFNKLLLKKSDEIVHQSNPFLEDEKDAFSVDDNDNWCLELRHLGLA